MLFVRGDRRDGSAGSPPHILVVYLCHNRCHIFGRRAVHNNATTMKQLQRYGQLKAMQEQGWTEEDFRREFGKSYL